MWAGYLGIEVLEGLGPGILWTFRNPHTPEGVQRSLPVPPPPVSLSAAGPLPGQLGSCLPLLWGLLC